MIVNLNKIVVPELMSVGFIGIFPYFRRKQENLLSFVSFQFNKSGGSFVVEFARTNDSDKELPEFARSISFENLNGSYLSFGKNRIRLKPRGQLFSHWFSYKNKNKEEQFEKLAEQVKNLLPIGEKFCQTGEK